MKYICMEGCHVGHFREFVGTACCTYGQSNTTTYFRYLEHNSMSTKILFSVLWVSAFIISWSQVSVSMGIYFTLVIYDLNSNFENKVNTLRPRQNSCHFAADIFECIFLNENVWISFKISLKFVPMGPFNNIPALVSLPIHNASLGLNELNPNNFEEIKIYRYILCEWQPFSAANLALARFPLTNLDENMPFRY